MSATPDITSAITYRLLAPRDLPALVPLMAEAGAVIGWQTIPAMYRAVCADALRGGPVVVLVAAEGERLVGYLAMVIDGTAYWQRAFPRAHPWLALRGALVRAAYRRRRPAPSPVTSEPLGEVVASDRRWSDSSATIAKVLHIGVHPACRGRGIAPGLYAAAPAVLRARGVVRLDAMVGLRNQASRALHRKSGFQLVTQGRSGVFVTRDIPAVEGDKGHDDL